MTVNDFLLRLDDSMLVKLIEQGTIVKKRVYTIGECRMHYRTALQRPLVAMDMTFDNMDDVIADDSVVRKDTTWFKPNRIIMYMVIEYK